MPAFSTEVRHNLSREEAVERLKGFVERIAERYRDQVSRMEGDWVDNSLNFALVTYGFNISGRLIVEDDRAHLQGQLPFAAVAFRGKIEQSIAGELEKALA